MSAFSVKADIGCGVSMSVIDPKRIFLSAVIISLIYLNELGREARVYNCAVGPAPFLRFVPRFDGPDNASVLPARRAPGIVWAVRQSRRFFCTFPAALL